MTIIGSTATKYWFSDFKREPKDIDFATETHIKKIRKDIEFLYNPIIAKRSCSYASPSDLLSLKVSHIFWDINWDKHMFDIQFLLDNGVIWDLELVAELRKFWSAHLPKIRRSDLTANRDQFFTNNVNEDTNEHDLYHLKLREVPTYTKILKNDGTVDICEKLFEQLSHEDKLNIAREEAYVMAYERYHKTLKYTEAYRKQLKDCIIKHFPPFVAYYAITHYKELVKRPEDYYAKINS